MNRWKLRFLNSEHYGAEVPLHENMVVGCDEELSDLVVKPNLATDQFVILKPDDTGVKLEICEATISVLIEKNIFSLGDYLPEQKVIFVGDLCFAVRAESDEWDEGILNFKIDNSETQSSVSENENLVKETSKKSGRKRLALVTMGVGLISYGIYHFVGKESVDSNLVSVDYSVKKADEGKDISAANPNYEPISEESRRLSELLSLGEYKDLSIKGNIKSGNLLVSGYVKDDVLLARLHSQLEKISSSISTDVFSIEKMQHSARLILSNLGLVAENIEQGSKPGYFVAMTDGDFAKSWKQAKKVLLSDIPGLKGWDAIPTRESQPLERIKAMLSNYPFSASLIYEDKGDEIIIVGRLNSEERRLLESVMSDFRTRVGERPRLAYVSPGLQKQPRTLSDFGISAVRSGSTPYVVYKNGKRYLVGARLPNGVNLQAFSEGEVTLTRGQRSYTLSYEDYRPKNPSTEYSFLTN
ncbi:type III secretion system inner membrane ring subunit SctD [Microbulbifer sp. TRSA007]|uniref:type III secretion system inner membrane ring subunit SctD n=1 Tax=Microbulbifer sp. TRSA007 TaxID=3243384 RepID=UPI0040391A6C